MSRKEIQLTLTGNEARAVFFSLKRRKSIQARAVCAKLLAATPDSFLTRERGRRDGKDRPEES